jgi:hypothetical protein
VHSIGLEFERFFDDAIAVVKDGHRLEAMALES